MKNLQRAVNYETLIRATGKSDAYIMPLFENLMTLCNIDTPVVDNHDCVQVVFAIDKNKLKENYDEVCRCFTRLNDNVQIIDRSDELWPEGIKNCGFLYLRGKIQLLGKKGLSVVGTRHPSYNGIKMTKEVVDAIGERFVTVSGLARGIDSAAHKEALGKGYDTIAVIGTNICDYYPPENRQLQDIISENGLLVSPFAPCRKTEKYFFMARNRIMSAISDGSIVIESGDAGGGVKEALFSEKQDKPVFVFRNTFENSSLRWPWEFDRPVVIDAPDQIVPYLNGNKKIAECQPSLFQLI